VPRATRIARAHYIQTSLETSGMDSMSGHNNDHDYDYSKDRDSDVTMQSRQLIPSHGWMECSADIYCHVSSLSLLSNIAQHAW